MAAYQRSGLVDVVEPDYVVTALVVPDDFRYWDGSLWGLHNTGIYGGTPGADIRAPEAWDVQRDARDIVVAVLDTGVRYTHEDLAANMWVNPGESGFDRFGRDKRTNGEDDDWNGYIDDVHGINTLLHTGDPNDDYGHGTHVAGILGGVGNNGLGVVGVAWRTQIMACKFIDATGRGSVSDAIACLDYARSKGAKIINASWGGYDFTSSALRDAIDRLRDADILFVAAAGNNHINNDAQSLFPASYEYDNVVSVAATDRNDQLAWFSNYGGATVHLGAPGQSIFSCWNESDADYRYLDGTSMAAPHVAGAAALIWSRYPMETHQQIIRRLLRCDPLPSLAGRCLSGGRLNLAKALDPIVQTAGGTLIWFDDALPSGAIASADGGDAWEWVDFSPSPFSGTLVHRSQLVLGPHSHTFEKATQALPISPGDRLFTYIYLDPLNVPREVMLAWNDGCWEHRAYWGENLLSYGANGTSGRRYLGALPPAGQWVRLEVPARLVALEGSVIKGMSFVLVNGRAAWDYAGKEAGLASPQ
ncbi:MAG: S8 family peptidase [Verrucomicrobiota bacterium]